MHIDERLSNRTIDIPYEANKLLLILQEKENFKYSASNRSMLDLVEEVFRFIPLSGNYAYLFEFLNESEFHDCLTIDGFCILCEKVMSLLFQIDLQISRNNSININVFHNKISQITKVINFDLNKLGMEAKLYNNDIFGRVIYVCPSDALALKAAETHPHLSESIINYCRPTNKGNLIEKEKSLHFIIKEVEPIAQNKSFKYPLIAKQAETIFNMFHLRHNNINGKKPNKLLSSMSNEELEEIFDMGYQLALELLILDEFTNIDDKVNDLRKRMKEENK